MYDNCKQIMRLTFSLDKCNNFQLYKHEGMYLCGLSYDSYSYAFILMTIRINSQIQIPVASFTKEVNPRLAKRPLKTNGRLANLGLTTLVKEATGVSYN